MTRIVSRVTTTPSRSNKQPSGKGTKWVTGFEESKTCIPSVSLQTHGFYHRKCFTNKRQRLLVTDLNIPREESIAEYIHSARPTVIISPSLYLGLDLKDNLSRFQIITKVPLPGL